MKAKPQLDLKVTLCDINGNVIDDITKVELSDEAIKQFARCLYDNRADIHKYIEDNKEEYEKWLKEQDE